MRNIVTVASPIDLHSGSGVIAGVASVAHALSGPGQLASRYSNLLLDTLDPALLGEGRLDHEDPRSFAGFGGWDEGREEDPQGQGREAQDEVPGSRPALERHGENQPGKGRQDDSEAFDAPEAGAPGEPETMVGVVPEAQPGRPDGQRQERAQGLDRQPGPGQGHDQGQRLWQQPSQGPRCQRQPSQGQGRPERIQRLRCRCGGGND